MPGIKEAGYFSNYGAGTKLIRGMMLPVLYADAGCGVSKFIVFCFS